MFGVLLGKAPAVHDPRTLRLASVLNREALPPVPPATNYRKKVPAWGMMLNDQLGCCAIAAPGHQDMAWTFNTGTPFTPTDAQILQAYKDVSGYNGTRQTDRGCVYLDVMKYWRNVGIGGRKILAFASVNLKDHAEVMAALYLTGGVQIGLMLPLAWRGATAWTAPPGAPVGLWQPGSWGGHAVLGADYDGLKVYNATWGMIITIGWDALDVYADECYCAFSVDQFGPGSVAPNGLNWEVVRQFLIHIGSSDPGPAPDAPPPPPPPPPPTGSPLVTVELSGKKWTGTLSSV